MCPLVCLVAGEELGVHGRERGPLKLASKKYFLVVQPLSP